MTESLEIFMFRLHPSPQKIYVLLLPQEAAIVVYSHKTIFTKESSSLYYVVVSMMRRRSNAMPLNEYVQINAGAASSFTI